MKTYIELLKASEEIKAQAIDTIQIICRNKRIYFDESNLPELHDGDNTLIQSIDRDGVYAYDDDNNLLYAFQFIGLSDLLHLVSALEQLNTK